METTTKQRNVETVSISINGMRCMGCVQHIQDLLSHLSGVNDVEVRLDEAKAEVKFVPATISVEQLTECIKSAGYEVAGTTSVVKTSLLDITKASKKCCCCA